jgi:hypothetical protein
VTAYAPAQEADSAHIAMPNIPHSAIPIIPFHPEG